LKKLDNHLRGAQTRKVEERFWASFPQVTTGAARDIFVNAQFRAHFSPNSRQKFLVRRFSYSAQEQEN
jgi:hypothetical protein